MEKRTRSKLICTRHLEDVPQLIHSIQTLLPVEEAARTCILSKSWLHAWSTIPTVRFSPKPGKFYKKQKKYKKLIDHTLQRYHRDNIPIESLHLQCHINNQDSAFVAENWIQSVASKCCLNELFLKICVLNATFTLPNELFSSENLDRINVTAVDVPMIYPLRICSNPVIKCASPRVLELITVNISDEVLDKLFSVCSLLEKIKLLNCHGLKNCKVKNLLHLRELVIYSDVEKPVSFELGSSGLVTLLDIKGLMIDKEFFNTIESKFPMLENLRLEISYWRLESLVIRSVSLKWLTLSLWEYKRQVNVQVHAPKLLTFIYKNTSKIIHGLSFPTIAPKQIKLTYYLSRHLDHSFFMKLREVLNSSSKFNIDITVSYTWEAQNIDADDLRKRVSIPVMNVEEVSFVNCFDDLLMETQFLNALFSICRPHYIKCKSKLAMREMMERKPNELEGIQVQDSQTGKWESVSSSSRSVLDRLADPIKIKLDWFS